MRNTLFFLTGGWACDCLYFECERRSDQRGGRESGGDHRIAPPADEMEEIQEVGVARAHEMLPRIRNRPL